MSTRVDPALHARRALAPSVTLEQVATRALSITVESTPDALERHVAAWDDLVAHAAEPNPFFEPYALLPAWRQLQPELRVVLVWAPHPLPGQPPVLVGLFPLVRSPRYKGLPLPVLGTWTHLYAYLATPLVRGELAGNVLEALFEWLRTQTDAALFAWRTLGADGAVHHALLDALNRLGFESFREHAHTRALFRRASTAEAYLTQALSGKKRKELRRQERRLAELGAVTYDELPAGGDLDAWLHEFVSLEARGWKGQGGTALGTDPAALALFRATARGAFVRGHWMTLALRLGGRAVAMKCNLRAGDGAVAFKIAYDEAYARFSPGVLLEIEQIERLHRTGGPAAPFPPPPPLWMDSGAAPDHPMIGHLWRDRLAIETLVVPTGRAPGALAVAALPLGRWLSRVLRDTTHRLRVRRP